MHMAVSGLLGAQHGQQSWAATEPVDHGIPLPSAPLPHTHPQALCWGGVSPQAHLRPSGLSSEELWSGTVVWPRLY